MLELLNSKQLLSYQACRGSRRDRRVEEDHTSIGGLYSCWSPFCTCLHPCHRICLSIAAPFSLETKVRRLHDSAVKNNTVT